MLSVLRTTSDDPDFQSLVQLLDTELAVRDGADHDFYHQFNQLTGLRHVVVAFDAGGKPIACGAIKPFDAATVEVKRMFTRPENRGAGLAAQILGELENWAAELGYAACVLETGLKQPEAIALYRKSGYVVTENYGQYAGVANSVCFRKMLS